MYSPLHISSYFGDFKSSRLFTTKGAETTSKDYYQNPLEVGKDKFSRDVLQNLNEAATTFNTKDLTYLVNCGENIDQRSSIVGQAPIHKAVISFKDEGGDSKQQTLTTIFKQNADVNIIDSNGWTALHHAAYNGDISSVQLLVKEGRAQINSFSNQFKTPLHFAAMNNHEDVVEFLIEQWENNHGDTHDLIEAKDEQKCTPLHLASRKGSL